jgi:hypothetical protein
MPPAPPAMTATLPARPLTSPRWFDEDVIEQHYAEVHMKPIALTMRAGRSIHALLS